MRGHINLDQKDLLGPLINRLPFIEVSDISKSSTSEMSPPGSRPQHAKRLASAHHASEIF